MEKRRTAKGKRWVRRMERERERDREGTQKGDGKRKGKGAEKVAVHTIRVPNTTGNRKGLDRREEAKGGWDVRSGREWVASPPVVFTRSLAVAKTPRDA